MFFVYVLKSKQFSKSYVGHTENVERRLQEHNLGKTVYTKKYRPWEIIYVEKYTFEKEVIQREKYLKSHAGRKRLTDIFNHSCGIV